MATRWAIANGNWSSTASWDGFTLPTSADDVFADGRTITVDQNIRVATLNTWQRVGGTTGGQFRVTASGIYITASQIRAGASVCLYVTSGAQNVNVFSDLTHINTVNYVASLWIDQSSSANITGTAFAGTRATGTGEYYSIYITNGTANMRGNVIGSGTAAAGWGVFTDSGSTLNLIGNITSGSTSNSYGAYVRNNAIISMTGSIIGANSAYGMYLTNHFGSVTVNGNIQAIDATAVFSSSSLGTFIVNGNISGGRVASAIGYQAGIGTLNTTGDILGGSGNSAIGVAITGVSMSHVGNLIGGTNVASRALQIANCTVNIVGNLIGGTGIGVSYAQASDAIYSLGDTTLTITGTVSSNYGQGILLNSTAPTIINGKLFGTNNSYTITHINTGTLTINGSQSGHNLIGRGFAAAGNLTINGYLIGVATGSNSRMIYDASTSKIITINGNVTQQNISPNDSTGLIRFDGLSTLNINGNVTGGSLTNTTTIYSGVANTINITGNVTGGSLSPAVNLIAGGATLSVTGNLIASSTYPAVLSSTTTSRTIVSGNIVNTNDYMAYYGYLLQVSTSSVINYTIQSPDSSNRVLSTTSSSNNVPLTRDVRLNTQFGSSNELTGTLAVPTASSVSYGVPVDNTIGTAILNVNDVGALLAGFII